MSKRGHCAVCNRWLVLRQDGMMRIHYTDYRRADMRAARHDRCPGSRKPPADDYERNYAWGVNVAGGNHE
jgi:hypothetical protein